MDNEFEGNADINDMQKPDEKGSDGGDIDEELEFGNPGGKENHEANVVIQQEILHS